MQKLDTEPIETIRLYVMREGPMRPSLTPVIFPVFTLVFFLALAIFIPNLQPVVQETIRIPAVFLPPKTFSVSEQIIPTGIRTYPAITAHGTLTITNGSVISQTLPAAMIFSGQDGVEVVTDTAVYVPAGSAVGYGVAYVQAHPMISGREGNIAALDVNAVEGSSVYIRNIRAFTGGQDAYSVKIITPQDRHTALALAREYLAGQVRGIKAILENPCSEQGAFGKMLRVTWVCRFVAYPQLPGFRILGLKISGKILVVDVVVKACPRPFPGK